MHHVTAKDVTTRISQYYENDEKSPALKNRSKLDIIYDILSSSSAGIKKTHIMSRANLSTEQMNFYFNTLISHSLLDIAKDSDNNLIYRTTQKGAKFLQCCAQIRSLVHPTIKEEGLAGETTMLMVL